MNHNYATEQHQQNYNYNYNPRRGQGGWGRPGGQRSGQPGGTGRVFQRYQQQRVQREDCCEGYFHPAMLRDPWLELRDEMGWEVEEHCLVEEQEVFREDEHLTESEKSKSISIEKYSDSTDSGRLPQGVSSDCDMSFGCPRCTRHHPGTPSECRSCDKVCRRCGVVGHFQEVHDVVDERFRKIIVRAVGLQLWN
eukprot:GFUD01012992.1.p1 GENE.GFUD01012992.1~~GFUD01012992.1.p1  ORF type:complete len:194 (+),score=53.86 GFUD01012992.1:70-651(+)